MDHACHRAPRSRSILPLGGLILACAAGSLLATESAPTPGRPPNIIVFLVDDQAWFGTPVSLDDRAPEACSTLVTRMPTLERLAAEGMRFSRAYAPAPICGPSRASIQTGNTPARLRMTELGNWERSGPRHRLACPEPVLTLDDATTLAIPEALRRIDARYRAAHFGKWHCDDAFKGRPFPAGRHGYDRHDGEFGNTGPAYFTDPNPKDIFGITERACAFMADEVRAGNPFFLQVSHYAMHKPARHLASTREHFEASPGSPDALGFAAMAEDMDAGLGRILATVASLGIEDETYLFYFADNGQDPEISTLDRPPPLRGQKLTLWEAGIRVPLIVKGPGITAGSVCREPVAGYDLLPTFLQLAGGPADPTPGLDGQSLVPLLQGRASTFQRQTAGLFFHYPHYRGNRWTPGSAIIAGNHKLITFYEDDRSVLFDLEADPTESRDLSQRLPEKAAALRKALRDHLAAAGAGLPGPLPENARGRKH